MNDNTNNFSYSPQLDNDNSNNFNLNNQNDNSNVSMSQSANNYQASNQSINQGFNPSSMSINDSSVMTVNFDNNLNNGILSNNVIQNNSNQPINVVPGNVDKQLDGGRLNQNLNQGDDLNLMNTSDSSISSTNLNNNSFTNANGFNLNNVNNLTGGVLNGTSSDIEEEYAFLNPQSNNRFINDNFDTSSTTIKDLTVDENVARVDYSMDPKVHQNIERDEKRKRTVTITGEMKVFLLIIAVMFLFMFIMPYIFDFVRTLD